MLFIVTVFLSLIGQNARNSGCDWFIQLSDNRYPITAFCFWTNKLFCCQIMKKVLNWSIRF